MIYFGASTGETGQYGIGEIVSGVVVNWELENGIPGDYTIDGEPVFLVFRIESDEVTYLSHEDDDQFSL